MRYLILMLILTGITTNSKAQCVAGNCRNGKGTYIFDSGGKYSGNFKNRRINGYGIFYFTNGNVYKGYWKNNYRHGKGKMLFATGDVYTGDFKANKFWGKGTYKFANGEMYKGEWRDGLAHGKGTYIFGNGEKYQGEFKYGKFNGFGTYFYNNGSRYSGYWKDNKREGKGKITSKDGQVVYGKWHEDILVSKDTPPSPTAIVKENKDKKITNKLPNCNRTYCKSGKGIYTYKDGSRWEGEFKNGKPEGEGICYYASGKRYEGSWKNNRPQGNGIMYMQDGKIYGGFWDKGVLVKRQNNDIEYVPTYTNATNKTVNPKKDAKVNVWAMIIGIGSYNHMQPLKYTDDDAYKVYAFLKSPEGGAVVDKQIQLLIDENASKENILKGLQFLVDNADDNDVIFIYYAGHGLNGAFVPYDYDGYNNLLMHKTMLGILDKSRAKHKLVVVDACHAGSMVAQRYPFKSMLEQYYKDFEKAHGGTALILSSKYDENSLEYTGMRQGVFSFYLIKGLGGDADYDKNGIVTVRELFDYVYLNVRKYTNNTQTPVLSGDFDPKMPVSVVFRNRR